MKATLEWNLPEEREDYKLHQQAVAMWIVLGDLDRELRALVKYGGHGPEKDAAFQQVRDLLHEFCKEQGVEL